MNMFESLSNMPRLKPISERTTYVPGKADLFMMRFRNGDNSWRESVFICIDADDRLVIAEMIVGYSPGGKPYTFFTDDVNFYETTRDRAILMGAEI